MKVEVNWHKKFLAHWMKNNDVHAADICKPYFITDKTDFMQKILLIGIKSDKTKIFKTLAEIETEMGCGIFEVIVDKKE